MGWGRTLLLGDVGNRLDIEDCERDVRGLKRELRGAFRKDMSQDRKIQHLLKENAELKLYLASVIRLLQAKEIISKDDLETIVKTIDAEDGKLDGLFEGDVV